ncbi:MAG: TlpA family protein disulfide reductase [Deltaproteobacteria bacterium]|nr:MAG: TlpA family protein disulfide reductase [Deltaproteobacteria bacterium]
MMRRSSLVWRWACVLMVVALGLGGAACSKKQVKRNAPGPITPLYGITLPQVDNVDFPLSALRGKVALVDFFSSSCTPCLYIIPKLKKLYVKNRQKGFLVVGIALEQQVKQILVPYLQLMKVDYPVLVADGSIYRGATAFGRIIRIPQSFLIDRCGKIRRVYVGVPDMTLVQREVQKLLSVDPKSCGN